MSAPVSYLPYRATHYLPGAARRRWLYQYQRQASIALSYMTSIGVVYVDKRHKNALGDKQLRTSV